MERSWKFGEGFPPKTIAVVGVSRKDKMNAPGYTGLMVLRLLKESGFQGRIYPVNPNASRIEGLKVYPRVTDIPEPLDLVTITVPAAVVPQVLEDCAAVGALNVHITTSGFAETGRPEGKELQDRIRQIALRNDMRVIGPNCMGFHVPSAGMKMFDEVPMVQGSVGFVSQSGGHIHTLLKHAPDFGFGVSTAISYGNALMLDGPDFLEYLAGDPETRIICMYIEGVRNGRRLMDLVKSANLMKPVVIWKGGLTESGGRAAASHTGSLAGDGEVWEGFFKQTGAIRVESIEEMAEAAMTLLRLKPASKPHTVVLSAGGGSTVSTGDICAEEGLSVPPLSSQTKAGLLEFISLVNQGVTNPLDVPGVLMHLPHLKRVLELLATDPMIGTVVLHVSAQFFVGPGPMTVEMSEFERTVAECDQEDTDRPNMVVAFCDEYRGDETERCARELREGGLAVYSNLRRACRALTRFTGYNEFLSRVAARDEERSP
ncbi:acetate--CoA ligase family protein [Thermodesulfobacteriota bacterium]